MPAYPTDVGSWGLRFAGAALLLAVAPLPRVLLAPSIAIALALGLLSFTPLGTRRTVLAAMVGMATSQGAILLFTTGIFQAPITAEFGWTRTQYFLVTPFSVLGALVTVQLIGGALDRYGVRRVALPSALLLVVVLIAYSRLSAHLWHLYLLAFLFAVLAAGTASGSYARLITFWFERRRGLALGTALSGMGIGGAVLSPLVEWYVVHEGWRRGFLALAAFVFFIGLPILYLWLHDSPASVGLGLDGERLDAKSVRIAAPPALGLSREAGFHSAVFRRLIAIFGALGFATGGMLFQIFPILTSLAVAPSTAATVLGSMGLALIAGRSTGGFLMDRFFAPHVAVAFLIPPLIGCAVLASGVGGVPALTAALAIGLSAGAEVDVLAYLVGRYLGTRAYATFYLWIYLAWSAGSGFGPLLAARISDTTGSYSLALWGYLVMFGLASVLLLSLGPFPTWREHVTPGPGIRAEPLLLGD